MEELATEIALAFGCTVEDIRGSSKRAVLSAARKAFIHAAFMLPVVEVAAYLNRDRRVIDFLRNSPNPYGAIR